MTTKTIDRHAYQRQMSEAALQAAVIEAAQRLGWLVFHTYDSRRSQPGFPDIVAIRKAPMIGQPSRILVAELKTQTGRVSPAQELWLRHFTLVAIPAFIWRPDQWHSGEIERVLRGEG